MFGSKLALLAALRALPLVDVGDVYQIIDTSTMAVLNKVR